MKHYKFLFLFLLSIILTGCTNTDIKATENFSIDEVANISVNAQSYQLTIRESTDDQIHVKYSDLKKNNPKVSVELSDEEYSIMAKAQEIMASIANELDCESLLDDDLSLWFDEFDRVLNVLERLREGFEKK